MKDFLEFLEEEFKKLTNEMLNKTDDDSGYIFTYRLGERAEVVRIYAKLLDIDYGEALDRLRDLV